MKKATLSAILLLHLVGGYFLLQEFTSHISAQNKVSVAPTPIFQNLNLTKFIVYSQTLTSIAYDEPFGQTRGNWITVRKETIVPENLEEVKSLPGLPEDLVKDFIEKNKSNEKLRESGYAVKFAHDVIEQKGTLESFFKLKKKKLKQKGFNLKTVVGLSKTGFNADQSKSLVYVEYFDLEKQLQKKYCLITWEREGQGIMDKKVDWL